MDGPTVRSAPHSFVSRVAASLAFAGGPGQARGVTHSGPAMDRRAALRSLAACLAAAARPTASAARSIPHVVLLLWGSEAAGGSFVESFRQGLREAGHAEGRTLKLDVRFNPLSRLDRVMRDTLAERPDVLVVGGLAAAKRARELTTTVPVVVATASDLVDGGVIASYSRPGGNVTGVADLTDEAAAKRLELIRAALPAAKRVALLVNPAFPATPKIESRVREAAKVLGFDIVPLRAGDPATVAAAVESMATSRPDALLLGGDPAFNTGDFIPRATALRVPVVHYWPGMAEKGALISYEVDVHDNFRRAAGYVDRILKGAKPADLPVYRPTTYLLKVNLSAARELGIALPAAFMQRVDAQLP
jgi:putative ABC transport system substrate-binding protein